MVGGQIGIDLLVRLAEIQRVVAAVVLGSFCLMMSASNRHAEMIRLSGQIRGDVIVRFLRLECRVAQIAPQHGVHSEIVRLMEHLRDFLNLPLRFLRTKIDRRADAGAPISNACLMFANMIWS